MESNMFPKPYIAEELGKFVLARLYTDREGSPYEEHQQMQKERYKTVMLPLYVIVEPDGSTLVVKFKDGYTRDSVEFKQFLVKGTTSASGSAAGL
jgi:hypothetical protein